MQRFLRTSGALHLCSSILEPCEEQKLFRIVKLQKRSRTIGECVIAKKEKFGQIRGPHLWNDHNISENINPFLFFYKETQSLD